MIDPDIRNDESHDRAPDRTLRQFAALLAFFLWALAARDFFLRGAALRATVLVLLATADIMAGLLRPGLIRPIFTAATMLTTPIRIVVSGVLLRVMYYGIFTPLAVFFRLIGRDALARRRVDADTYWSPKTMPKDLKTYFRQS